MVHVQVAEDAGHFQRVVDVGFAAQSALTLVGDGAELVGAAHLSHLVGGQVFADLFLQFGDGCHGFKCNLIGQVCAGFAGANRPRRGRAGVGTGRE